MMTGSILAVGVGYVLALAALSIHCIALVLAERRERRRDK